MKKFLSVTLSLLLAASMPLSALAETYDLAQGSITVEAKADGNRYVSQTGGVQQEQQTTDTVIHQTDSDTTSTDNTITIKAGKDTTANVTIKDTNISTGNAAIKTEGKGNVNLNVEGINTVSSGDKHAGVEKANDGNLTIGSESGEGELTANGGHGGAGIGGGYEGSGSDVTISKDSRVEATGGDPCLLGGYGAAIGGGGYNTDTGNQVDGSEIEPDTSELYTTGKVERKSGDGTVLDTIVGTVSASSEEPDKREPLYRVLNLDGSTLKHQAETADGVLTLTAKADGAILTGTLRALGYLQNQGIEKITFTDGTHSAELVLADLIAKGHPEDVYVLTLGAENTLTLNGEPIDF